MLPLNYHHDWLLRDVETSRRLLGRTARSRRISAARFAELDQDGNEVLDFEEFYAAQPDATREQFSREEIRGWFDAADDNGDGELTLDEASDEWTDCD